MSRIKSHIFDSLVGYIEDGIASQQIEYDQANYRKEKESICQSQHSSSANQEQAKQQALGTLTQKKRS